VLSNKRKQAVSLLQSPNRATFPMAMFAEPSVLTDTSLWWENSLPEGQHKSFAMCLK